MSPPLPAEELLDQLAGLQRRAHILHGDANDRSIKAGLRALSTDVARISATLSGGPGVTALIEAAEQFEAAARILDRLEHEIHRERLT